MSIPFSIQVEDLGKRYRLGVIGRQSMAEELQYWICKATGKNPSEKLGKIENETQRVLHGRLASQRDPENPGCFWSLRDVNFTMKPGEIVGVIGTNGAGKSTLLKILARITEPTVGRVRISGRMSSLLEVGTGFHPELTGRENIFVNGAILGMYEEEIIRKFDDIVAFSEIDDFIETPVKRYSSGMRTRLAFAVAAHLEPDVLLLDEVLSVGDASFRKKCAVKMKELAGQGRTVLIVSHQFTTVSEMCSRCLWMEKGRLVMDGPTEEVLECYTNKSLTQNGEASSEEEFIRHPLIPDLIISAFHIRNQVGALVLDWRDHEDFSIEIDYELEQETPGLQLGVVFSNNQGGIITESLPPLGPTFCKKGRHHLKAQVPGMRLTPGPIRLSCLAKISDQTEAIECGKALSCKILPGPHTTPQRGRLRLPVEWVPNESGPL